MDFITKNDILSILPNTLLFSNNEAKGHGKISSLYLQELSTARVILFTFYSSALYLTSMHICENVLDWRHKNGR